MHHIIVCIKQVLDTSFEFYINQDNKEVRQKSPQPVYTINRSDRKALEAAIQLKKQYPQICVSAITLGAERVNKALLYCLAQGADRAIHIVCDEIDALDAYGISFCLSKGLARLNYDLILFGNYSMDIPHGQVGPTVAELLDLPQVTGIVKLDIFDDFKTVRVQRRLIKGNREVILCPLPAVLVVDELINEPHYVSINKLSLINLENIQRWELNEIGINRESMIKMPTYTKLANIGFPRPRPKLSASFDTSLSPMERQKVIMQGGLSEKQETNILEGPSDSIAAKIEEYMLNERIIEL